MLQEYQFRGIQKAEWNNLFSFIKAKRLKIENVDEVAAGPGGAARPGLDIDLGEDIDTGRGPYHGLLQAACVWLQVPSATLLIGYLCMCMSISGTEEETVTAVSTPAMEYSFCMFVALRVLARACLSQQGHQAKMEEATLH